MREALTRVSIRVKLVVFTGAVMLSVVLGQTIHSLVRESVAAQTEISLRARLVLVALAGAVGTLWTDDVVPDLEPFVHRMQSTLHVTSLVLVTPAGTPLRGWGMPLSPAAIDRTVRLRLSAPPGTFSHFSFSSLTMLIATPVMRGAEVRGYLVCGLRTDEPAERLRDLMWGALSTSLLWLALGGGLTLWLTGRLTAPLIRLARGVEGLSVAGAELGPLPRADGEIGIVQDSVAALSHNLKEERANVRRLTWALRHQVDVVSAGLSDTLAQQRAILDATRDAILLVRREGTAVSANAPARALFGDDVISGGVPMWTRLSDPEPMKDVMARAWASGAPELVHARSQPGPGGEGRYLRIRVTPYAGAGAEPRGLLWVCEDASESERLVAQMLRSERLASMGALTAGLAHQIGNQLNAILGYTQLLTRRLRERDPESLADLSAIHKEGRAAVELMDRVLMLARSKRTAPVSLTVESVVRQALELTRLQAEQHAVEVKANLDAASCVIEGDSQLLVQAVLNVLVNAIQAMPKGGVLNVSSARHAGGCFVYIGDTGTGIPAEALPHIFEPFFTTKETGTGLGLAIVQRVLELHGGSIRVSETGQAGTTFEISFPAQGGGAP